MVSAGFSAAFVASNVFCFFLLYFSVLFSCKKQNVSDQMPVSLPCDSLVCVVHGQIIEVCPRQMSVQGGAQILM